MGTLTLNAKTDLTYEEIYEGYANGKSRLPKIIKQIEAGTFLGTDGATPPISLPDSQAADGVAGINILRRRTDGGNAQTPGTVGQDSTTVVAKLISAANWDSLIAGYSGPGGTEFVTPPSYNLQTVNVRAVVKEPFDLIDQVAGINYAQQVPGAASETRELSGREAKIQEKGTVVRIREIDFRAPSGATADVDVRDYFANDRIGGGGDTGEVHGVDLNIVEVTVADSEGRAVGAVGVTFDTGAAGSTGLSFKLGETGSPEIDVAFDGSILTAAEVVNTINSAVAAAELANPGAVEFDGPGLSVNDPVCLIGPGGALELHSRNRGFVGESGLLITTDNANLGFTTADNVVSGATGEDGLFEQTIVDLSSLASYCKTTLRYGTAQFGVLQVVGTTNGLVAATASAYIVHPDFLEDLIKYQ